MAEMPLSRSAEQPRNDVQQRKQRQPEREERDKASRAVGNGPATVRNAPTEPPRRRLLALHSLRSIKPTAISNALIDYREMGLLNS
jgi:hypothetical protein